MSKVKLAVLALIGANIIWGMTPPIFKWALEDIQPFTLAFFRFFLAAIIFLPFTFHIDLEIKRRDFTKLFILGFTTFAHISFFFLGLELSTSINAPIIASAAPIFLMMGGIFLLKEHPGKKKVMGGIVSLIGVLLIVLLPVAGFKLDVSVIGNLFLMLSTVAMVFEAIFLKELSKDYSPISLVFWTFILSASLFLPFFANEAVNHNSLQTIGINGIVGIIFGAIFASAIAYFLFFWAMKYMMASEVGLFTYLDPVVTLIVAAPLLGETPTPIYIVGSVLVFLGIYIAEGRLHWHPVHLLRKA